MIVEVLGSINSGKHNKGDIVNFPDSEAEQLIDAGVAKATDKKAKKEESSNDKKPMTKAEDKKAKAKAKAEAKKAKAEEKTKAEAKSNGEN